MKVAWWPLGKDRAWVEHAGLSRDLGDRVDAEPVASSLRSFCYRRRRLWAAPLRQTPDGRLTEPGQRIEKERRALITAHTNTWSGTHAP